MPSTIRSLREIEPGEDMFVKRGRRYVKAAEQFASFPSDGVWYVADGRQTRTVPPVLVGRIHQSVEASHLMRYEMEILSALHKSMIAGSRPYYTLISIIEAIASAQEG